VSVDLDHAPKRPLSGLELGVVAMTQTNSGPPFAARCTAAAIVLMAGAALAEQAGEPTVAAPPTAPAAPDVKAEGAKASGVKPTEGADQSPTAGAGAEPAKNAAKPSQPSDDLLIFEDVPVVISASRREQKLSELSVPVSVVTAKDIHYRGITNIAEMLTQVPGMNVLRIDRNRWAVGVHGLHEEYADRTIVLINGRNAGNPALGAADFGALPVLPEDIDRIEVVRGPGGAVWGANAFNGAINIITKRPEDAQGFMLSTRLNEYGDTDSQVRFGAKNGDIAFRVSLGFENHESSDDAINHDDFYSRDYGRSTRFDTEAVYTLGDRARLRFGFAGAHVDRGDAEFGTYWPLKDERLDEYRLFAKLEKEFEDGSSGYVQWFCNLASENRPALFRIDSVENDLEAQYGWNTSATNRVMVGGNARLTHFNQDVTSTQDIILPDSDFDETWFGAFVTDRWQATERLALEGQFRVDTYSETQADWSARVAALYALDKDQKHVLRLAAAKAFRAPLAVLRGLGTARGLLPAPPFPPGTFGVTLIPPANLDHEEVYSLEAGYTGKLTDQLDLRVNGYYQRYTDLIGVVTIAPLPFVGTLGNIDGADGYGLETELNYSYEGGRIYAWYAYNALNTDQPSQEVRAFYPAEHTVGLGVRHELCDHLTVNADYRYTDATHISSIATSAGVTHQLDLALTAKVLDGRGELQVGVEDLFDSTAHHVIGLGGNTATDTPGRTLFVRFQYRF
jgi:iron complex outermembrane receptor protein